MSVFSQIVSAGSLAGGLISGGPVRASLVPEEIGMPLFFHFNPGKVTVTKTVTAEGQGTQLVNSYQDAVKAVGNLQITVNDCRFAGYSTKMALDQLVEWATPQPVLGLFGTILSAAGGAYSAVMGGSASQSTARLLGSPSITRHLGSALGVAFTATNVQYRLPVLLFSWGVGGALGISYKVTLDSVTVSYERFNSAGVPIYATANLTMKEYSEPLPFTNPSSGGPPGRTKHVVTAGENVVRIANQSYGTPTAWRAVAEANGLDDPLRIKPGRLLYLPGPGELEEGAQA